MSCNNNCFNSGNCNCTNRCGGVPCGCPNANCACPPDYSIAPATISCPDGTPCEDTLATQCIYTSSALTCINKPAGTDLNTILLAMDTKICQCGSCSGGTVVDVMSEFWVNSLNPITGDGSAINPFQTLDEAYNKIIGSGTVTAPDNPNVTVKVLGGTYATDINIYVPFTRWDFQPSALVTFTGSDYFIDSSVVADSASPFAVTGYMEFRTETGGFIKNEGSHIVGSTNKHIYVEATSIWSSTATQGRPLINHNLTYGTTGTEPIITQIKLQGSTRTDFSRRIPSIISASQATVVCTGGILNIDLGQGEIGYGIDPISGANTGVPLGHVIDYNNADSTTFKETNCEFTLRNGYIWSQGADDMNSMIGVFNIFIMDSVKTKNYGGTVPGRFLNIGQLSTPTTPFDFHFLLKEVYIDPFSVTGITFSTIDDIVIDYTGTGTMQFLDMQDCVLYRPLKINFSNIRLSRVLYGLSVNMAINMIGGRMNLVGNSIFANNAAAIAGGLNFGDIYQTATGQIMVVF